MRHTDYTGLWPWKHFSPAEVACKHCGELWEGENMPLRFKESMDAMQRLRDAWAKPIHVTSAHRCSAHNTAVGGVSGSQHLRLAFDCVCPAGEQAAFANAAREAGFKGIGLYPHRGFVHLDMDREREW